jgi:ribosomal protein S18 acetylase RimI-like enzyme
MARPRCQDRWPVKPPGRWNTLAAVRNATALRVVGPASFLAELDALLSVYGAAMRPPPLHLPGRRSIMARHAGYAEFRAVTVADNGGDGGDGGDGQLIAFAYGFRGTRGQWWHDVVRTGLTAAAGQHVAAAWLADSFEVAEVHVRPGYQRRGIGRAMVLGLTAGCPRRTALLSTLDAASPARRLYASLGFTDLLTGFSFPGNEPPYAVMGAALPLRESPASPRPSR